MYKFFEKHKGFMTRFLCIIIAALLVSNVFMLQRASALEMKIQSAQEQIEQHDEYISKHVEEIKEVTKAQQTVKNHIDAMTKHEDAINAIKGGYGYDSDLSNNNPSALLTANDMNKIIDYWIEKRGVSKEFAGKGQAFINASIQTGMNPIYILAHAAAESGWGSSHLAKTRHNYFGINAVDQDPGRASTMGGSLEEGITAGADWIKRHFYNNGYTSLRSMKHGNYATDPKWAGNILHIMNESVSVL
jgi:gp100